MSRIYISLSCILLFIFNPVIAQEAAEGSLTEQTATSEEPVAEGSLAQNPSIVDRPKVAKPKKSYASKRTGYIGQRVAEGEGLNTTRVANEFVDLLASSEYSEARKYFDKDMLKHFPTRLLRKSWLNMIRDVGPYNSKGELYVSNADNAYEVAHVPVKFGETNAVVRVVVNGDQVTGLYIGQPLKDEFATEDNS